MEEVVKAVANYGVSIVIVGCFLWDWISNKKRSTEALIKMEESSNQTANAIIEMKNSNSNTAKSLELLQNSMENQTQTLNRIEKKLERTDVDGKD